ncbi:MAG: hypothetical protein ACYC26_14135 [Phycisphaerales bacterium]
MNRSITMKLALTMLLCVLPACAQQQTQSECPCSMMESCGAGLNRPAIEQWDVLGLAFLGDANTTEEDIEIGRFGRFGMISYDRKRGVWWHDLGSQKKWSTYQFRAEAAAKHFFQDMPRVHNSEYTFHCIAVHYRLIVLSFQRMPGSTVTRGPDAGELFYDSKTDKIVAYASHPADDQQPSQPASTNPPTPLDQADEHLSVEQRWDVLGLAFPSNAATAGEPIQIGRRHSAFGKIDYNPETGAWFQYQNADTYKNLSLYKDRALAAARRFLPDEAPERSRTEFAVGAAYYRLIVITYHAVPQTGWIVLGGSGSLYYDAKTDKIVAWTPNGH